MFGYLQQSRLSFSPSVKYSRTQLFHRSRDHRFLFRVAVFIGVVSLVAGFLISLFTARSDRSPFFSMLRQMNGLTPDWQPPKPEVADFDEWVRAIHRIGFAGHGEEDAIDPLRPRTPMPRPELANDEAAPGSGIEEAVSRVESGLAKSPLPEDEKHLLLGLLRGLHGEEEIERPRAAAELRAAAAETPPRREAAGFLGEVLEKAGDYAGAIDAYRMEVDHFPGANLLVLHRLVNLLRQEERLPELDELMARPDLQRHFSINDHIDRAVDRRDYLALLGWSIRHDLRIPDPWLALLSLFAGAVWFIITTRFARRERDLRWLYPAALALGWLSASVTLFAVFVQEHIRGFSHEVTDDTLTQVIYFVAGVALREETLKLLCFLPLVPYLVRRGGEIDALVCAGLVGLGFAVNENIGYVDRGGEFTAWSRFLTANFAHIAWTGVAGLALFRCWRRPRRQWDNLLYDFLIVVAAHGAYDALIVVPAFSDYSFASLIIFALSAYLFLDQASHLMPPDRGMVVAPIAVFVVGGALLIGVTFCYACWAVPFYLASAEYIRSLAGVVPVAFIFINRLRAH